MSNDENGFASYIVELMQSIGPVISKKMFGGYGFFLDGLMFALMADNTLYLKADIETAKEFKALGLEQFTYSRKGKEFAMSYYRSPDEILEASDEMYSWANKAYGAALRAAAKKRKKGK